MSSAGVLCLQSNLTVLSAVPSIPSPILQSYPAVVPMVHTGSCFHFLRFILHSLLVLRSLLACLLCTGCFVFRPCSRCVCAHIHLCAHNVCTVYTRVLEDCWRFFLLPSFSSFLPSSLLPCLSAFLPPLPPSVHSFTHCVLFSSIPCAQLGVLALFRAPRILQQILAPKVVRQVKCGFWFWVRFSFFRLKTVEGSGSREERAIKRGRER